MTDEEQVVPEHAALGCPFCGKQPSERHRRRHWA